MSRFFVEWPSATQTHERWVRRILTLRIVNPLDAGANPPESNFEGDGGRYVGVGQEDGLFGEEPDVAHKRGHKCHDGNQADENPGPAQSTTRITAAHISAAITS